MSSKDWNQNQNQTQRPNQQGFDKNKPKQDQQGQQRPGQQGQQRPGQQGQQGQKPSYK